MDALIFAHRGASGDAPENTLAAFQLALEQGADAIELDVKLSADGVVMVMHDASVDRTTNGSGKVRDLSAAQLKCLDAGAKFSPQYAGEPVPTLDEVFEQVGGRLLINIELTNYATPFDPLVERVAERVQKYRLKEGIMFSSFLPHNLARARRLLPGIPRAQLTGRGMIWRLARLYTDAFVPHQALHPYYTEVTAALVDGEHRRGRAVNVWTVDDPREMRRLYALKVDGIITDHPRLARQVLKENA